MSPECDTKHLDIIMTNDLLEQTAQGRQYQEE